MQIVTMVACQGGQCQTLFLLADLGWEQGAGEQKGDSFLMNYVIHANEWAGTSAAVK